MSPSFGPGSKFEGKVQLKYDKFIFHVGRKTVVFEALLSGHCGVDKN